VEEACKILDVPPPREGKTDMTKVMERFKRLFDINEPKNGGSFYLQSKILRARQRIEMEAKAGEDKASRIKEQQEGWKPKVYKD
jgi:mitochondrial import inner membrane translocase subunit TIM16